MEERWNFIPGLTEDYQVSDLGRVRSRRRCNGRDPDKWYILKPRIVHGYETYHLCTDELILDKKAHRLVWSAFVGDIPVGLCIDHIDLNKRNNSLTNLRLVTPQQNAQHVKGTCARRNAYNPSSYRGVHYNKRDQRWVARIYVNKKLLYIGSSKIEEEAAALYVAATKRYFKEYAAY